MKNDKKLWKIDHKKQIREIVITEKGTSEINFSLPEKKNKRRGNRKISK